MWDGRFAEIQDEIPVSFRVHFHFSFVCVSAWSIWISKKVRWSLPRLAHNAPVNHPRRKTKGGIQREKVGHYNDVLWDAKGLGSFDWSISNEYLRRPVHPPLFDASISSKEEVRITISSRCKPSDKLTICMYGLCPFAHTSLWKLWKSFDR